MNGLSKASIWVKNYRNSPDYIADQVKQDFAVSIEKSVTEKGLNRTDLAQLLGTSKSYVTKVLRGDTNLTIESMAKITHALNLKIKLDIYEEKPHLTLASDVIKVGFGKEKPMDNENDRQERAFRAFSSNNRVAC